MLLDPVRQSDLVLAARCAAGEREAQREFFHAQRARVHLVLYRILGGNRGIDDLVQDAFFAIFRALPSYRGDARLSTFVDRITTRIALRHLTNRPDRPSLELVSPPAGQAGLDERADAREALRRLYRILDGVEAKQRVAFTLHVIEGRPVAEVAAMMEATAVATRVRVFRARRAVEARAAADPFLARFVQGGQTS